MLERGDATADDIDVAMKVSARRTKGLWTEEGWTASV